LRKSLIKERTATLLEKLSFQEYGDRLIADLPLGLRQKLAFQLLCFTNRKLFFLDEPTEEWILLPGDNSGN
jgi:ABC-type multidrug transport system ATPase subunit